MGKKKKQGAVIEYPQDITINPEIEVQETTTEITETLIEDQVLEVIHAESQDEAPATEGEEAPIEESPVEPPVSETDESPTENPPTDTPDAEPQAEVDAPSADAPVDVYLDNWHGIVAEIAQQSRMRRGYTERAIRLYPNQVAMIEDVGSFRHLTPNKVIQSTLSAGIDHRFALVANTLIADPLVQADPADLDAVMMEWLNGQISKVRAEAQATENPADRATIWQRVGRMEEIRDFYRHHPAFRSE